MGCTSCNKSITSALPTMDNTEWLNREQVKVLCVPCYNNMVTNNISKIKKDVLLSKINTLKEDDKMTFYEVLYVGAEGTSFNFFGHVLNPNSPVYFGQDEIPLNLKELKKLPNIKVVAVDLEKKPTKEQAALVSAKIHGTLGIEWVGMAHKRVNDYGTFHKNQPRFDLSLEVVEALSKLSGFRVVK